MNEGVLRKCSKRWCNDLGMPSTLGNMGHGPTIRIMPMSGLTMVSHGRVWKEGVGRLLLPLSSHPTLRAVQNERVVEVLTQAAVNMALGHF